MLWVFLSCAFVLTSAIRKIPIHDYEPICQNDGFYVGGLEKCKCKPYFNGTYCDIRICMNGGYNYNDDPTQRCVCPPGFIGAHCEPRACTGDGSTLRTFDPPDNARRSVSYILSWTADIADKVKGKNGDPDDDFTEIVCNVFDKRISEVFLYIAPEIGNRFEDKAACNGFIKSVLDPSTGFCASPEYCPLPTMDPMYIQQAVAESLPNSPVFIIANANLTMSSDRMGTIVQLATSLGVTINTLLFAPLAVNYLSIYQSDQFKQYGELAARTGGFYITPYDTQQRQFLGNNGISQALFDILTMVTTTKLIYQDPPPIPITFYSTSKSIYLSFTMKGTSLSDLKDKMPDFKFLKVAPYPPENVTEFEDISDTGFTKIYKYDFPTEVTDNKITATIQTTDNQPITGLKIFGVPAFPLGVAVSTADQVDASHPHAIPIGDPPNGPSLLVSAGEGVSLTKIYSNSNWSITSNGGSTARSSSNKCLYGSAIGTVKKCQDKDTAWLLLTQDSSESTGLVPLYCGNALYTSSNRPVEPLSPKDAVKLPVIDEDPCIQPPSDVGDKYVKPKDQKIFGLIVEDNKDVTDKLLTNPGNIFTKLVSLWDKYQDKYQMVGITTVVLKTPQNTNRFLSQSATNISDVMDNALNNLTNSKPNVQFLDAIKATIDSNPKYLFYDLFIVSSNGNHFKLDSEFDVLGWLYQKRIRLHWLWIDQQDPDDLWWSRRITSSTGGISHSFATVDEVADMFNNFDWLFTNELVYSQEVMNNYDLVDNFTMTDKETAYIVLEGDPTHPRQVEVLGQPLNSTYISKDGFLTVYKYSSTQAGKKFFNIQYVVQGGLSIRIYSDRSSLYSVAFASGNQETNGDDVDMYGPIYGYPVVFPIFANIDANATFSILPQMNSSSPFYPLKTDGAIVPNCNPYNYSYNYNWVCSVPKQLYQLRVDTATTTRMFSFVCNADPENPTHPCGAHAISYKDGCVCKAGWVGDACNVPDCLNGGTPLSGGTCQCPDWTNGFFCEYATNATCDPPNAFPEYRSKIGSLIFVIEESKEVQGKIQNWIESIRKMTRSDLTENFQASQIIIVTHSDTGFTQRLATNDPRGIPGAFNDVTWTTPTQGLKSEEALLAALQLQTTDRSLLVWVTSSIWDQPFNTTVNQKNLFKLISDKRAELRIYTTKEASKDPLVNKLTMVTASLPVTLTGPDSFKDIFTKYLSSSLPVVGQFGPILNTIAYATDCDVEEYPIEIYIPKSADRVYLTMQGLSLKASTQYSPSPIETGLYEIDTGTQNLKGKSIRVNFTQTMGATVCGYSIETLSQEQVAFGVTDDITSEVDLSTSMLPNGVNWMNVKWNGIDVPSYTNPETSEVTNAFQNIQQWPVYTDNTYYRINWTNPGKNIIAMTHNLSNTQCTFPYLPMMLTCDGETNGFLTRIYTQLPESSAPILQKMVFVPCLDVDLSLLCKNKGQLLNGKCECQNLWTGYDCSVPICDNGGTPNGEICNCPAGSFGVNCEKTDRIEPKKRFMLFIGDLYVPPSRDGDAGDPLDDFRLAINTTTRLYEISTSNATVILAETSTGEAVYVENQAQIDGQLRLWKLASKNTKFTSSMERIADEVSVFLVNSQYDYLNVFFITKQTGLDPSLAQESVDRLRRDQKVSFLSLGFGISVDQLSVWGDTKTVNSVDEFVRTAIEFNEGSDFPYTGGPTTTVPPPTTTPYSLCTMNARADIAFMIDATFQQNEINLMYEVLTNFYANLSMSSGVIKSKDDFCTDSSQWDDSWNTRVSGMNYYTNTYKGNPPNYCVDSSSQLASSTKGIKPQNMTITSMSRIVQIASILLEDSCKCRRWNDSDPKAVPQIMIWIPYTPNYGNASTDFNITQLTSFKHYLLPYKFRTSDAPGTMWSNMEEIKLPSTPNMNRTDIVQALWDLLCDITNAGGVHPTPADDWNPPEIFMEDDEMGLVDGGLDETKENQLDAQISSKSLNERESQQLDQDPPQRKENTRSRLGFSFLGWEF